MTKTSNKIKTLAMALILAGMLVIIGCRQKDSTGDSPPSQSIPEVGVVVMKSEPVALSMELPGRISPHMVAEIRPQVTGIIVKRLFTEGGEVKAGDALYQIDQATYQAAYASARAVLIKSEANVFAVRLKAERYKKLVATNAVSLQDYDDTAAALKQANADIEAGKAAVDTARINSSIPFMWM